MRGRAAAADGGAFINRPSGCEREACDTTLKRSRRRRRQRGGRWLLAPGWRRGTMISVSRSAAMRRLGLVMLLGVMSLLAATPGRPRLPVLSGGHPQRLRCGGRRPGPPLPRLQPQHLPDGRRPLPARGGGRLPGLPPSPPRTPPCDAAAPSWRPCLSPLPGDHHVRLPPRRRFVSAASCGLAGFAFLDRLPDAGAAAPRARRARRRSPPTSSRSSA